MKKNSFLEKIFLLQVLREIQKPTNVFGSIFPFTCQKIAECTVRQKQANDDLLNAKGRQSERETEWQRDREKDSGRADECLVYLKSG